MNKPLSQLLPLLALLVSGFACGIVGSSIHVRRLAGCGACLVGTGIAVLVYWTIRDGVDSSNWGTFRRDQEPIRFWFSVLFTAFFAAVFLLGGLLQVLIGTNE